LGNNTLGTTIAKKPDAETQGVLASLLGAIEAPAIARGELTK
jgi:hypothetical protein